MGKLRTILSEINKQLEAAAIAEMRVDIARETLLGDEAGKKKQRSIRKSSGKSRVTFNADSLSIPGISDKELYSNS